ncbi:MAG TPA: hypothetical protein DEG17_25005 [Cyanobacteria bacterium UBA11149]|nr:hypothetical protein [Cyanobacteria bacterium UBA11367]HBE57565.1 hypothetical protein [Cyanobacteria bacterium UBA11366]HBK64317.1 hypothetical protein [Cyanobacteria bacterium UBA11166]HBR73293.1 hypothetical protein [Cyanobacteria bacterium UBA11159]HBS67759.1 hypothetical protein [Cyanobacteria bacterium UBA11153]HBW92038.1 hypothetical protein [Cyanobacteria bacterium UBA11149]HCA97962.1 hypothetical protein [Cyanobacteria bacterium UBA9226]
MTITEADIQKIQTHIAPLLGQKPWHVSIGVGSFITFDFGTPIPRKFLHKGNPLPARGEWHLWIYMCAWRLEKEDEVLAACEDSQQQMEGAVKSMEGLALQSIQLLPPAWDTIFTFEDGIVLRTFSIYSDCSEEGVDNWLLFTPGDNVLSIGPGSTWSYGSSSAPRS